MRFIELLSPARNLECGLEAIRHGADAVYIGAPRFGARAAAGNSIEDIAELVRYAHQFNVKIYVTVNTLLNDEEVEEVDHLIDALQVAKVDALITQDTRLPAINRGRLPLHSSTQMDNRTIEDVRARQAAGYTQTVLARELSLEDIRAIHAAVPEMPLEVFVHGALCVSYSGRCYASEFCFGRSANRGECAQFCRLPFDLIDANGRVVTVPSGSPEGSPLRQRHLLSLKDMNRAADLEALMDAGATSFKIEGRLKDVSYVKNITAYYRQRIDAIIARRPQDYCRSSLGTSTISFTPDPFKSFNRGFTDYFLHGRTTEPIYQPLTPKSLGEPLPAHPVLHNGDGLCFFDAEGVLRGFRVNRVDEQGRIHPADTSVLKYLRPDTPLYRNYDAAFEQQLSRPTADRRIPVRWLIEETEEGFKLGLTPVPSPVGEGGSYGQEFEYNHELARTPQEGNIRRQLMRLGDTPYTCTEADIDIRFSANWFIPSSVLGEWRRKVASGLSPLPLPCREGSKHLQDETSSQQPHTQIHFTPLPPLMSCRHCLRHALGYCTRDGKPLPFREPLALRLADGRTFPLRFDCARCEMQVLRDCQL